MGKADFPSLKRHRGTAWAQVLEDWTALVATGFPFDQVMPNRVVIGFEVPQKRWLLRVISGYKWDHVHKMGSSLMHLAHT